MITGTKSKCRSRTPTTRRRAIGRLSPCLLLITVPPSFPVQLDRVTVYPSRFMLRMIETVVVSERRAGRDGFRPAEIHFGHSLVFHLG